MWRCSHSSSPMWRRWPRIARCAPSPSCAATRICSHEAHAAPAGQRSLIEITTNYAEQTAVVAEQIEELRAHVDALPAEVRATRRHRPPGGAHRSHQAGRGRVRGAAPGRTGALRRLRRRCPAACRSRWPCSTTAATALTISAITGLNDTRVYAKPIAGGRGRAGTVARGAPGGVGRPRTPPPCRLGPDATRPESGADRLFRAGVRGTDRCSRRCARRRRRARRVRAAASTRRPRSRPRCGRRG